MVTKVQHYIESLNVKQIISKIHGDRLYAAGSRQNSNNVQVTHAGTEAVVERALKRQSKTATTTKFM